MFHRSCRENTHTIKYYKYIDLYIYIHVIGVMYWIHLRNTYRVYAGASHISPPESDLLRSRRLPYVAVGVVCRRRRGLLRRPASRRPVWSFAPARDAARLNWVTRHNVYLCVLHFSTCCVCLFSIHLAYSYLLNTWLSPSKELCDHLKGSCNVTSLFLSLKALFQCFLSVGSLWLDV